MVIVVSDNPKAHHSARLNGEPAHWGLRALVGEGIQVAERATSEVVGHLSVDVVTNDADDLTDAHWAILTASVTRAVLDFVEA